MNSKFILSQLDEITSAYMTVEDNQGTLLQKKYTQLFIYALVQKHIFDLEAVFSDNLKQNIDIFDFVFHMLKFTQQNYDETIFIIIALIDFFKMICEEENQGSSFITFADLSNYLCKFNPQIEDQTPYSVEGPLINTYHLPKEKKFFENKSARHIREVDINPPLVLGGLGTKLIRLNKQLVIL